MLVWPMVNNTPYGPFSASPYGGASFELSTGAGGPADVFIELTDEDNTVTYCSQTYNA